MDRNDPSRRALLQALAATLGAAVLPAEWGLAEWPEFADAAAHAAGAKTLSFFSEAEAADVDAVAAQIIPTDDTPGAREAGVVFFIDRALATFLSHLARDYRAQLADFQAAFRKQHSAAFASLAAEQQIEYLKTIDRTPFFQSTRLLTLLGMFSLPKYGGNRDGVGWKLLGFEVQHAFQPPFGFYDRDYPGFVVQSEGSQR